MGKNYYFYFLLNVVAGGVGWKKLAVGASFRGTNKLAICFFIINFYIIILFN